MLWRTAESPGDGAWLSLVVPKSFYQSFHGEPVRLNPLFGAVSPSGGLSRSFGFADLQAQDTYDMEVNGTPQSTVLGTCTLQVESAPVRPGTLVAIARCASVRTGQASCKRLSMRAPAGWIEAASDYTGGLMCGQPEGDAIDARLLPTAVSHQATRYVYRLAPGADASPPTHIELTVADMGGNEGISFRMVVPAGARLEQWF